MGTPAELNFDPAEIVSSLYQGILGRMPDEVGKAYFIRLLGEGRPLAEIVRQFVNSPEFQRSRVVSLGPLDALPANRIELDLAAAQRDLVWLRIAKAWSEWGKEDPYLSVLGSDEFRMENISAAQVERFYDSGEPNIDRVQRYLARHGRQLPKDGTCVDYGCGLGRTTLWLARQCERVLAIDVSEPHLALARENLKARGVHNVEFHLLQSRSDLQLLHGIDFFHSVIVLQHNPPPIIFDILTQVFEGLNDEGTAFFQVPTYGVNYSWEFEKFAVESLPQPGAEMHVLPQSNIFALAATAGCLPLEVQPDGWTGIPHLISNTFLFAKSAANGQLQRAVLEREPGEP